jgi:hypothetical protein
MPGWITMLDEIYKQLTALQKQIDNLVKPEIPPLSAYALPMSGRLTLTSGTPVLTSNVTAATTVYFTPYKGNRVSLYNGVNWLGHAFSELSVAVPSTVYRLFDIFIYSSAGTLTLEAVNWNQSSAAITGATNATPIVITSNGHGLNNNDLVAVASVGGNTAANGIWSVQNVAANTFELEGSTGSGAYTAGGTWYKLNATRATAITLQNGRYVKSGSTGRLYLGTGMTTGTSGQTEFSPSGSPPNLLLWNYFNRLPANMLIADANSHTYTSTTPRIYRNVNTNKMAFVAGVIEDSLAFNVQAQFNFDAGDSTVSTRANLNRTGAGESAATSVIDVFNGRFLIDARYIYPGNTGYNFLQLTQIGGATSPDFQIALATGEILA